MVSNCPGRAYWRRPLTSRVINCVLSGGGAHGFAWKLILTVAPAALAVGAVILIGRVALRPLFHSVALTRSPEFFMAACLLVVLGAGLIASASGLSMALGAFLAGLLLAETEFRREIEVTIEPFKGLALGLFFVSVGAELDLSIALAKPAAVFGALFGFVALKTISFYPLALMFGASPATARDVALALGPGGEFAFVLVGVAVAGGVVDGESGRIALLAAALSTRGDSCLAASSLIRVSKPFRFAHHCRRYFSIRPLASSLSRQMYRVTQRYSRRTRAR